MSVEMWWLAAPLALPCGILVCRDTPVVNHCPKVMSYPNSGLRQICPHGNLLPDAHVRISVPGEESFQFLQLLRSEVGPLPSLTFLVLPVLRVVQLAVRIIRTLAVSLVVTRICKRNWSHLNFLKLYSNFDWDVIFEIKFWLYGVN